MKILLFDIDGTLLYPGKTPRRCINQALAEFLGREISLPIEKLAGFTDPVIVENVLREYGIQNGELEKGKREVLKRYLELLERFYPQARDWKLYPGVRETLKQLSTEEGIVLGLLTGNVKRGAKIKLAPFGIWDYFLTGAFGDDAPERNLLPPVAMKRFEKILKSKVNPEDLIVIGDTHRDIEMAKKNNLRSIAVLHHERWLLRIEAARPDLIMKGFVNPHKLIQFLNSQAG